MSSKAGDSILSLLFDNLLDGSTATDWGSEGADEIRGFEDDDAMGCSFRMLEDDGMPELIRLTGFSAKGCLEASEDGLAFGCSDTGCA